MTLEDKVHGFRLHALHRAEELGNVSAACRGLGISRTVFYRWKKRLQAWEGRASPQEDVCSSRTTPLLGPVEERAILATALAWPTWGPRRVSLQLARQGIHVSPSTVWRALRRRGLGRREARLLAVEGHAAQAAGLLTERTRRNLRRSRHVAVDQPGELVCLDTFYIGKLKGVGQMWQITACDAASSYAWAKVVPARTAGEAAWFLTAVLIPEFVQAGWKLEWVLTDRGSEFKGEFDQACRDLGIIHTRTKPRHAWTNGFVERLQGTILHEHWRVAFRRRYFTSAHQLQVSLDGFLRFSGEERPHQGYRTQGRTPAEVFWGVAAHASAKEA